MINDIINRNLDALEVEIESKVASNVLVGRNFQDISEHTDVRLGHGVVNIISTGFTRTEVGIEHIDTHEVAIVCWVYGSSGIDIERKELALLGLMEQAIIGMGCATIVNVSQSAQTEVPYGHLAIDIKIGVE